MKTVSIFCATLLAAIVIAVAVQAGPDNVKFPKNYAKGVLLKPCFTRHLQKVPNQDFVFSLDKLKAAAVK